MRIVLTSKVSGSSNFCALAKLFKIIQIFEPSIFSLILALEYETDRLVGPWKVRSEVVSAALFEESSQSSSSLLEKRAVQSMDTFMDGNVEYFVTMPTRFDKENGNFIPTPLVFRKFSKADRPRAWKSCAHGP